MSFWHKMGSKPRRKSLRETYSELERLEKKAKEAEEKEMMQKRIYELQHARRIAIFNRIRNVSGKVGSAAAKAGTAAGQAAVGGASYAYKNRKKFRKYIKPYKY